MIALIGEKEIWRGFNSFGIKLFEVSSEIQVLDSITKVLEEKCDFVFISEFAAKLIKSKLDELYKKQDLNIIILPSLDRNQEKDEQIYFKRLKSVVEKAMGVDVLS